MAQSEMDPGTDDPRDDLDALPRNARVGVEALRRLHVERGAVGDRLALAALQHLLRGTDLEGRAADLLASWEEPSEANGS